MIPFNESVTVIIEGPGGSEREVPANVSWRGGEAVMIPTGTGIPGASPGLLRYVSVTYSPDDSIPQNAVIEWQGMRFTLDGPEELHTDLAGIPHHRTRQARSEQSA